MTTPSSLPTMCLNIPPSWRLYRTGKPFMNPFPKEKKYHPNVKRLCNHGAEERKPVMGPCEECIDEGVSPEEARMSSKVMYRKGNAGGHRFQVSTAAPRDTCLANHAR